MRFQDYDQLSKWKNAIMEVSGKIVPPNVATTQINRRQTSPNPKLQDKTEEPQPEDVDGNDVDDISFENLSPTPPK